MKLYAISDLHVGHPPNRDALAEISAYPEDWLIVAGDIGEKIAHFHDTFQILTKRFAKLFWVPGNHDLWTVPSSDSPLRGVARYEYLVELCRSYGVVTPEDPYVTWAGDANTLIVPTFALYDYSFRAANLSKKEAITQARAADIYCVDEILLNPDPYPSIEAWCAARVAYTERRLATLPRDKSLILINHWPLREDLARLPRIPQFRLWCGTKRTESWLQQYPIETVIYGHLHIRRISQIDGIQHREVSLGYPRHWDSSRGLPSYLQEIR